MKGMSGISISILRESFHRDSYFLIQSAGCTSLVSLRAFSLRFQVMYFIMALNCSQSRDIEPGRISRTFRSFSKCQMLPLTHDIKWQMSWGVHSNFFSGWKPKRRISVSKSCLIWLSSPRTISQDIRQSCQAERSSESIWRGRLRPSLN